MRAIRTLCVVTGLTLAALSVAARASAHDNGSNYEHACNTATGKAAIDGCTWVIQSNNFSGADLAIAYSRRGGAFAIAGQFDRAIDDYTHAIKLKPDYVVAIFNRGLAYGNLRDYQHSVDDFTAAIRLEPNIAKAYTNRAIGLAHLNKNVRAIEDLDKAIQLDPNDAYAVNERGWVRAVLGQLDAALADCRKANQLKPNDKHVLNTCAFVHFRQGHYAEAISDTNAVLALDSRHADSLYIRGLSKTRTGDATGGDADVHEAKNLDPKITETYARYGM
jgi:tetratricopeptide (TPR) repeat protein